MTDLTPRADPIPKLALNRLEAKVAMSVGIRMIDQLIAGRRGNGFPVVYLGSKPVIPVRELQEWLAKQVGKVGQ